MKIIPGLEDPRVQNALSVLRRSILSHYPAATFEIQTGGEPEGVYLVAKIDLEDTTEVIDAIIDDILDIQVEQYLPVFVLVHRPASLEVTERSLLRQSVA